MNWLFFIDFDLPIECTANLGSIYGTCTPTYTSTHERIDPEKKIKPCPCLCSSPSTSWVLQSMHVKDFVKQLNALLSWIIPMVGKCENLKAGRACVYRFALISSLVRARSAMNRLHMACQVSADYRQMGGALILKFPLSFPFFKLSKSMLPTTYVRCSMITRMIRKVNLYKPISIP